MPRILLALSLACATASAPAAEVAPAPSMRDGLRAVFIGSIDAARGAGDLESTQLLYMMAVSPGTKYGWTYRGQADVYAGRHDLNDGRQSVRNAYADFIEEARRRRAAIGKSIVIGRYLGAQTVRTDAQLAAIGRWPAHNARLEGFSPEMLRPPRADSAATDYARIDYRVAAARDRAVEEFLAEAAGQRDVPQPDMMHFDEVEFTPEIWPGMVDVFSRLKPRLHAAGVRLSINLGGYGWRDAPRWAPDVLDVLPAMADSIQVEGLPDRSHAGLQSSELTKAIYNVRRLLASGMGLEILPFMRPDRVAPYKIVAIEETRDPAPCAVRLPCLDHGAAKLVATLESPAWASHPAGGAPWEMTVIGDAVTPAPDGFPTLGWSLVVDPDNPRRVYLFRRDGDWATTLDQIREQNPGFELTQLVGLPLFDQQALHRTTAAFALAACRDFDDSILIHYSPQSLRPDVVAKHSGRLSDDWTRWPELLGEPLEPDPRIVATGPDGTAQELRRRFRNATLVWYVDAGCVRFEPPE